MIAGLPYLMDTSGDMGVEIQRLCMNSRDEAPEGLFFCFKGIRSDAHFFADQAVRNGCVALIVERFLTDVRVPQVLVSNGRAAMARVSAAFYGHPAEQMKIVGITGTKGKTTTSYMLKSILETAGHKCGLIGTTGSYIGDKLLSSNLTTPDPIDLNRDLRSMADEGAEYVVMEVSAHALDMHRLDGLEFEAGVFTNLSRDHLDYFGDMESYLAVKKRFFTDGYVKNTAYNADDEAVAHALQGIKMPNMTFGICQESDVFARDIEVHDDSVSMMLCLRDIQPVPVVLNMVGVFNIYNAIAAASLAMILGISLEYIKEGLEAIKTVPGRVELLQTQTPFKVILDYSHSTNALENILQTVRLFTKGKVIVVFGCGGGRDRGKRPDMGERGGRLADYCVLTSDNPRMEDPMDILKAVEEGIKRTQGKYIVIENRKDAIKHALLEAEENDTVVLAGKGDETYQDIMGVKYPFNEKEIVIDILTEMKKAFEGVRV